MAVTITGVKLRAALRLSASDIELAESARLLEYATAAVLKHAPDAPTVVHNEAVVRLCGYLFDQPFASRSAAYAHALRNSGAAAIMLPYRVRRAGSVAEAIAVAGQSGSAGNPVVNIQVAGDELVVTYADGTTVPVPLSFTGVDADAVRLLVADWAETDNTDQIPLDKLANAIGGAAAATAAGGVVYAIPSILAGGSAASRNLLAYDLENKQLLRTVVRDPLELATGFDWETLGFGYLFDDGKSFLGNILISANVNPSLSVNVGTFRFTGKAPGIYLVFTGNSSGGAYVATFGALWEWDGSSRSLYDPPGGYVSIDGGDGKDAIREINRGHFPPTEVTALGQYFFSHQGAEVFDEYTSDGRLYRVISYIDEVAATYKFERIAPQNAEQYGLMTWTLVGKWLESDGATPTTFQVDPALPIRHTETRDFVQAIDFTETHTGDEKIRATRSRNFFGWGLEQVHTSPDPDTIGDRDIRPTGLLTTDTVQVPLKIGDITVPMNPSVFESNALQTHEELNVGDTHLETNTEIRLYVLTIGGIGGPNPLDPTVGSFTPEDPAVGTTIVDVVDVREGRLPGDPVAMRLGWSQSRVFEEGTFERANDHPIDGAAVGTTAGVSVPVFPPALVDDETLYLGIWIAGDPQVLAIDRSEYVDGEDMIDLFPAADRQVLEVDGVAGFYYPESSREYPPNDSESDLLSVTLGGGPLLLTDGDVEDWAKTGNVDPIPGAKVGNAVDQTARDAAAAAHAAGDAAHAVADVARTAAQAAAAASVGAPEVIFNGAVSANMAFTRALDAAVDGPKWLFVELWNAVDVYTGLIRVPRYLDSNAPDGGPSGWFIAGWGDASESSEQNFITIGPVGDTSLTEAAYFGRFRSSNSAPTKATFTLIRLFG